MAPWPGGPGRCSPRKSKLTCSDRPGPVRVLAEHDLGLLGVKLEAQGLEPLGHRGPQLSGLFLGVAVNDDVVRVALERTVWVFPVHPLVERVVHEQVGQNGRDRRPLGGSLLPRHEGPVRHLHGGFEPPCDVEQHPTLAGVVSHRLHEKVVWNASRRTPGCHSRSPSPVSQHRRRQTAKASWAERPGR